MSAAAQQTNLAVVVRHAPNLNGSGLIEGSVQQLLGESVTLNGGFTLTGDLLVPGTPTLLQNGNPNFGGTIVGSGSSTPTGYQVTLNGNCSLHYLRTRTTPVALPTVAAPPQPVGTRSVNINNAGQSIGDPVTLRNLTLNGGVGQYAIPPGTYGNFIANGGSGFILGVAGATNPAIYNLQNLTLNGQTRLDVVGPVILTLANGFSANGILGATNQPTWLQLQIASGGFTLNGGCTVHGNVTAPAGTVIVNGNSLLVGMAQCDRLIINSGGIIRAGTTANQSPTATPQNLSVGEDGTLNMTLTGSDPENATLTYTVLSQPGHGTLTGTAPNLIYVPGTNYNGGDSFTFKVNDGQADSATATISITVTPVNDAPVAQSQTVSTPEDTALNLTLSGSDVEHSPLTFQIVTPPSHGSLSNSAPNLSYTPNPNYHGPDNFTYRASDGQAQSAVATVSITVNPVDDAPVASAQTVTTDEDTATSITLTAVDVEGDGLDFTVLTQPAHGSLSGTPPNLIYTPTTNYNGSDSFTFRASDAWLDSDPATIILIVRPVNDVPVATPQTIITAEDTATNLVLAATDADGDILSFNVVAGPTSGTLNGTAPDLVFSPAADFHGTNVLTFVAVDGNSTSAPVAITLIITPVNDRPVAEAKAISLNEDTTWAVSLSGTDVDGDALTYTVTLQPTNGTLSGVAPNLTYTSATNYHGTDVFSYVANDGITNSVPALVTLTIQSVNDAPVVTNQSLTTDEDTVLPVTLTGSDVENDALTFAVVTPPAHGTLSGTPPVLIYTPATNYHGADNFTFSANDGQTNSALATIFIAVNPINDAPVAAPATVNTLEDTPAIVTLSGSDEDGDALNFNVTASPTHGSLSGVAPNLSYTPATNYFGPDQFSFTANDSSTNSQSAVISIIVAPLNDTPIVASQSLTTDEDAPLNIVLGGNDVDGDTLSFTVLAQPIHGNLSGLAPNLTYTPATNYNGADSFTFVANDGQVNSVVGTINLTVRPVNDAPVAGAQNATTQEDVATSILLTGIDVDGDVLSYSVVTPPAHGLLSGTAPNLIYTPATNYNGNDSFTFVANDSHINSATATVTISVSPINDAPTVQSLAITAFGGQSANGNLTASDVDGDPLIFSLQTQAGKGTAVVNATGSFTYTPQANAAGTDSFVFRVSDGTAFATATVSVTLSLVNHAPIVQGQSVTTDEDVPLAISLIGSDADNDPLTFEVVSGPSQGTFLNGIYTPAENFNGTDSFEFIARDGITNSASATVNITVNAINDAPQINVPGIQTVIPGAKLAFNSKRPISVSDADHNGGVVRLSVSATNGTIVFDFSDGYAYGQTWPVTWISDENNPTNPVVEGTLDNINVVLNGWGRLNYIAPTNFTGDVITLTIEDLGNSGSGGNKTDTRTIVLLAAKMPPIVAITQPASQSHFAAGAPIPISVAASDVEGPLASVKLYADGELLTEWATPPYEWVWTNATPRSYELFAIATDADDASVISSNVVVTVVDNGSGDFAVDAGANQIISLPDSALLTGQVQVQILIAGSETNVVWSKVSGPGTVQFSDPAALFTSAQFSEPGTYILKLEVAYGGGSRSDTVKVDAIPAPPNRLTSVRSSRGSDFWLTFLENEPPFGEPDHTGTDLYVTSDTDTFGKVYFTDRYSGVVQAIPFFVPAHSSVPVPVWTPEINASDRIATNAIHVTTDHPVTVYGLNYSDATTDGYLALPTSLLGTNYMVLTYPNTPAFFDTNRVIGGTCFAIVATEDDTHAKVTLAITTGSRAGRVPYEVVLNRGETYRISDGENPDADLTGTLIHSDKPVAVFAGNRITTVPRLIPAGDHLVEQVPPMEMWGNHFVTMPLATRTLGDTFRFLARTNNTRISINGTIVATLNQGQFHEQIINGAAQILSSQPILVAQYANSSDYDGSTGDPFMMYIPPFEQFGGDYVITTPLVTSYWTGADVFTNYITLVTRTNGIGLIQLDGVPVASDLFQIVSNSAYASASFPVTTGSHHVNAPVPFGVCVYGWTWYESYGFMGGVYFDSVGVPAQLELSQVTPFAAVDTDKFVTAWVTDAQGRPLRDLEVDFTVTGANPATGHQVTGRDGYATFSYHGTNVGEDVITARLVDTQKSVTNIWKIPTGNTPPIVSAADTVSLQHDLALQLAGLVSDDGPLSALSVRWTQLSGHEAVIENPTQASTRVLCQHPGVYVFELAASDAEFESRATITVRLDLLPSINFPAWAINPAVRVGSNVWLVADASDPDDSISKVEFFVNGQLHGTATNRMYWEDWAQQWTPYENGQFPVVWIPETNRTYELLAVAYDQYGSAITSAVTTVQATYPPQISVMLPDQDLSLPYGASTATYRAQASDPDGVVTNLSVYFISDFGERYLIHESGGSELNYTGITDVAGSGYHYYATHPLLYVATDNLGISTEVAGRNITLEPPTVTAALTTPENGATYMVGQPVNLTAAAQITSPADIFWVNFYRLQPPGWYGWNWFPGGWSRFDYVVNPGPYTTTWIPTEPGDYAFKATVVINVDWSTDYETATNTIHVVPAYIGATIVAPTASEQLWVNRPHTITLDTYDPTILFDHAEFFANNVSLGQTTNTFIEWTPAQTNAYILTAKVFGTNGVAYTASNSVTVQVIPPPRPVVTITHPTEGSRVRANAETIAAASLSDPASITTNVQFFVDGVLAYQNSTYFAWFPTNLGNHAIHAVALTSDGDSIASAPVNVTVAEMYPPVVNLLAPTNEQRFAAVTLPVFLAQASDSDGTISSLTLALDYTTLGETNGATLEVAATNITPGWHETIAQALDNDGVSTSSDVVRFFIERGENTTLPLPQDVVATAASDQEIQISWTLQSTNPLVTGMIIERHNITNGLWEELKFLSNDATNYADSGLPSETLYSYRVATVGNQGQRSAYAPLVSQNTRTTVAGYAVLDISDSLAAAQAGQSTSSASGGAAAFSLAAATTSGLAPIDIGSLEPLWMADDGTCLLSAGPGYYVVWKFGTAPISLVNSNFIAHRLTRHGVVVGLLIDGFTQDEFGNQLPHTLGAKWVPGEPVPEPLTSGDYRYPKDAPPATSVGDVYSLTNFVSGQPEFLGTVSSHPTLHDIWDLNASGAAVGMATVRTPSLIERHEFDGDGIMNWFTIGERGVNAGYSTAGVLAVNYRAMISTAVQFGVSDQWRWLGPLNIGFSSSSLSIALLANDTGKIAGSAGAYTGDPAIDLYAPTHAFRINSASEFDGINPILTDLGTLSGGLYSFPRAMSQAGELVGYSDYDSVNNGVVTYNPARFHAVYWATNANTPTDLGALGPIAETAQGFSDAFAINDRSQIVGYSLRATTNGSVTDAVLWQRNRNTHGTPYWEINNLNDTLSIPGWQILNAVGINNDGLILAKANKPIMDNDGRVIGWEPRAVLLVNFSLVPKVLAVNSDFDEKKFGAYNLLQADNADTDPAGADGLITPDILADYFRPALARPLLDNLDADASIVIHKNTDRFDSDIQNYEEGNIRIIAIRASDNDWVEVPQNANIVPDFLLPGGAYAGYRDWYVEGLHPGRLTLEFQYASGTEQFVIEQRALVATQKSRGAWRKEVRDQIFLQTQGRVNMKKFNPEGEFAANQLQVAAIYTYYQWLFQKHPREFIWAGMAKLAGAPIYAGLQDADAGRKIPGVGVAADNLSHIKEFQNALMDGALKIFEDLAWPHRAYEASGIYALEYVDSIDPAPATATRQVEIDVWRTLDRGARFGVDADIIKATHDLLLREQGTIIPPTYQRIGRINLFLNLGSYESLLSLLAQNPIPGGPSFQEVVPHGDLGSFADRWAWINNSTNGMIPIWVGTVSPPYGPPFGPPSSPSLRWYWVTQPITLRAMQYRMLPQIFW